MVIIIIKHSEKDENSTTITSAGAQYFPPMMIRVCNKGDVLCWFVISIFVCFNITNRT